MSSSIPRILSDEELLVFLRKGDAFAFEELYSRYHPSAYRYLVNLVKVPAHAEDLVHEVFIKIWELRDSLEIQSKFSAYLYRSCHNKGIDWLRRMATEKKLEKQLLYQYFLTSFEQGGVDEVDRYQLLQEALESLPPQRRRVYELCKKDGKSYAEVAAELNISVNTVKEHMARAKAALRYFLHEKGEIALIILFLEKIL